MFDKVKSYYDAGLWSLERVLNVVGKVISAEQFYAITGLVYSETATGGDSLE